MTILHLIDALDGHGAARQLELLALALRHAGEAPRIACIGPHTPRVERLSEAGVTTHLLGWTRWLDGGALRRLRRLVDGCDLVQVWRLAALRTLAMAAPAALPRAVFVGAVPAQPTWLERQLLQRVRRITIAPHALPAVPAPDGTLDPWAKAYPRRIVCAGPLERSSGLREAIWAIDVLGHVLDDVHLLIAGSGPFRGDLASMIERLEIRNAHLLGDRIDTAALLTMADVVWVPSLTDCGGQIAVEAMALGKVVIASDVPALRALVRDGETGCLVPRGAPVALARQTLALLRDAPRRAALAAAAQADVTTRFALPLVAAHWRDLYNTCAA